MRDLSGDLVERQSRNQADNASGHSHGCCYEVRLIHSLMIRETVDPSANPGNQSFITECVKHTGMNSER